MKNSSHAGALGLFFLTSFLFSWACWAPGVLSHFGVIHTRSSPITPLQLLGDFGPTIGALAVTARDRRARGQLGYFLRRTRLPLRWYAASLFIPAIIILSAWASRAALLQLHPHVTLANLWLPAFLQRGWLAASLGIIAFAMAMLLFAAAEEIGWRGFALPRLITSIGFLPGSLSLGVMWVLWHLPLAFVDGNPLQGENFLLFMASSILGSLLMAYIWVHTSSLPLAIVFHATGNFVFFLVQPTPTTVYRTVSTLVCVLVIACFWRMARRDNELIPAKIAVSGGSAGTGA